MPIHHTATPPQKAPGTQYAPHRPACPITCPGSMVPRAPLGSSEGMVSVSTTFCSGTGPVFVTTYRSWAGVPIGPMGPGALLASYQMLPLSNRTYSLTDMTAEKQR